jgi:hypothetical protein
VSHAAYCIAYANYARSPYIYRMLSKNNETYDASSMYYAIYYTIFATAPGRSQTCKNLEFLKNIINLE